MTDIPELLPVEYIQEGIQMSLSDKGNRKIRIFALLMALVLLAALPSCGSENASTGSADPQLQESEGSVVFRFHGTDILLGEVYLYAETVIEDYEKKYGKDIWNMEVPVSDDRELTLYSLTRKDIIENIVKVKVLVEKAPDYGISVDAEMKKQIERDTEAFWKNITDEQIGQMELTREQVERCMTDNLLASKVYGAVMEEAGIEISDERARETTFFDLCFPCYTESSDGVVTPMDDAAKKEQYDKAVQAYNTLISPLDTGAERDPASIAAYYGLKNVSYTTMTPEEIRAEYGKEIADMIYTLEDGATSLVTETEYGYHLFYMKSLTDREATDKRKEQMEREEMNTYFSGLYTEWLKDIDPNYHYEDSVDFEVYDRILFR